MSDTNEHEERRRAAKAYRIVRFCERSGWTADDVQYFDADVWADLARCTGVNPPSDRTKAIVLHILRERSNG